MMRELKESRTVSPPSLSSLSWKEREGSRGGGDGGESQNQLLGAQMGKQVRRREKSVKPAERVSFSKNTVLSTLPPASSSSQILLLEICSWAPRLARLLRIEAVAGIRASIGCEHSGQMDKQPKLRFSLHLGRLISGYVPSFLAPSVLLELRPLSFPGQQVPNPQGLGKCYPEAYHTIACCTVARHCCAEAQSHTV